MCLLKQVNWVTASFLVLTPLVAVIWGGFHIAIFGVYPFEVLLFLLYIAAASRRATIVTSHTALTSAAASSRPSTCCSVRPHSSIRC
jgi:hypothetical protein